MPELDSKAMKAAILDKKVGAVIWNGKHIDDVKDVPSDEEIAKAKAAHVAKVEGRKLAQ